TEIWGRAAETFGVPNETLIGRQFDALGHFAERSAEMPGGAELMAAQTPFRRMIFLAKPQEGDFRRLMLSGVPVFDDENGGFTGYRGTAIDLTARAETPDEANAARRTPAEALDELALRNRQLDTALEEARVASRVKTEFLAMMSHELRTPLNAIIGLAEMSTNQIQGPLPETYRAYFEDIHGAGRHLLTVIEQMLDATEIDGGKIALDVEPVAVAEVIREARAMIVPQAREKKMRLENLSADPEAVVLADPARLRQILVNLLNNAVKFTTEGGRLGIETALVAEGMLDITVWDTGIGIPATRQSLVFESFYKGDADIRLAGSKGIGLGLSISRRLARLMDGELSLESELGVGSRLILRLPLAPDPGTNWPGPRG
ncbi:MAG: sensor histidine kinase, partial [Alphaproteobacteria bacterium]